MVSCENYLAIHDVPRGLVVVLFGSHKNGRLFRLVQTLFLEAWDRLNQFKSEIKDLIQENRKLVGNHLVAESSRSCPYSWYAAIKRSTTKRYHRCKNGLCRATQVALAQIETGLFPSILGVRADYGESVHCQLCKKCIDSVIPSYHFLCECEHFRDTRDSLGLPNEIGTDTDSMIKWFFSFPGGTDTTSPIIKFITSILEEKTTDKSNSNSSDDTDSDCDIPEIPQ